MPWPNAETCDRVGVMVFSFYSRVGIGFFFAVMLSAGVVVADETGTNLPAGSQEGAAAGTEAPEMQETSAVETESSEAEEGVAANAAPSTEVETESSEAEEVAAANAAPSTEKVAAASETATEVSTESKSVDRRAWRKDLTLRRRPGSYLGGGMGYTNVHSWYTVKLRDVVEDYALGPMHGYLMFIRVGDAFYDWLAAGFQIDMAAATFAGTDAPGASSFALYVDVTFYPWRGLGLRPSVGVGFGYSQAGKESYELGFGGPLTLSFAASYEFRVSRFFTMGPFVQVSWVKGEDFDALFFNVGLEMLKWFRTAEG